MAKADRMSILGHLKAILYPRTGGKLGTAGNNFGIIKVIDEYGETYTVKGNFTSPLDKQTEYEFTVEKMWDEKYGETYKLIYFQTNIDFTDIDNQKGFLRKVLTQKQVDALYNEYEDVLSILEAGDVEKLTQIKGIGTSTANRMIKKYKEAKPDMKLLTKLSELELDFSDNLIERLKTTFGSTDAIINVLDNDPYELVKVPMVGFSKADQIALNSGKVQMQSSVRIAGWIVHYLQEQLNNGGNSYIYASELNTALYDYFGREILVARVGGGNNIVDAIDMLKKKKEINIIEDPTGNKARRKIYLQKAYDLEKSIALELKRLLSAEPIAYAKEDWEERVAKQEEKQGFSFDERQIEAIGRGINSNVFVIGGYGGTGKSSLLKGVLAALGEESRITTCALSGRAAANLRGIGRNATIHKLLDYRPGKGFEYNKNNPLPYDIVILDELSMVGGELFLKLLEAVPTGARFIALGDPGQLESLGQLCLMRDLLDNDYIESIVLTKVHRQAAESGIISTSMDVREGVCFFNQTMYEGIDIHGDKKDLCTDLTTLRDNIINRVIAWYRKMVMAYDPIDIMCIGFTNTRGKESVWNMNYYIQDFLGKRVKGAKYIHSITDHKIYEGDVVMCMKNNYHASDYNGNDTPIFNGWRGIVEKIDDDYIYMDFKEANSKVRLDIGTAAEYLTLGYAVTCHKSQGSTIPCVLCAFSYSAYTMLNRNILYTGMTRASKKCVIIAESAAYQRCVQTEFVSTKNTFFRDGMLEEVLL